jgi:hypothetical protein
MKNAGDRPVLWLDAVAIGASFACLVHCLLLPLLFAALPALTRVVAVPESFHIAAFLFAIPASAWAMRAGHRHHGALLPAVFGAIGLLLLGGGALGGFDLAVETGVTVLGSLLLASAHWVNWSLRRRIETRQCC